MRQSGLIVLLISLGLIAALVHWWRGWESRTARLPGTSQHLAETALAADSPADQRQAAAAALTSSPTAVSSSSSPRQIEAVLELRRIYRESPDANVRAQSIESLALAWDFDGMDVMLDALDDPAPHVRGRAAAAVARMTGRVRAYKADGPLAQRQMHSRHWRADWEEIKSSPHYANHQQRQKASHEKRK